MTNAKRIIANGTVITLGKIVTGLISAVTMIYVARRFGAENYGKLSVAIAYLFVFQSIAHFGMDSIFVRQIAADPGNGDKWLTNAIACKLFFAIIALALCWGALFFLSYSPEIKLLIVIASLNLLFSFSTLIPGMFQAQLKTIYYVAPEMVVSLCTSAFTFVAVFVNMPLAAIVAIQTLGVVPLSGAYIFSAYRYLGTRLSTDIDRSYVRLLILDSALLFVSAVFLSLAFRLDQIMLFSVVNGKALGLYAAAVKIVEIPNFVPGAFLSLVLPVLSASYVHSRAEFDALCKLTYKWMSIVSLPLACGTAMLSGKLVGVIYGPQFEGAAVPLAILSFSMIFVFLGSVHSTIVLASRLQKYLALFTFFGACLSCILYVWLIPKYGTTGAAIATTVSYSGAGMLPALMIKETRAITIWYHESILRVAPASLIMMLFIHYIIDANVYLIVPLAACVYTLALLITRALHVSDIRYVASLVGINRTKKEILV